MMSPLGMRKEVSVGVVSPLGTAPPRSTDSDTLTFTGDGRSDVSQSEFTVTKMIGC